MRHAFTVLRKELRDMLRDRKNVIASFLVPIVLMPIMFSVMGLFMGNMMGDEDAELRVLLTENAAKPEARAFIENALAGLEGLVVTVPEDAADALRQEQGDVLLDVPQNAAQILSQGKALPIAVVADEDKTKSMMAGGRVSDALDAYSQEKLSELLTSLGIDPEHRYPLTVTQVAYADFISSDAEVAGGGGFMVAMMVPMLLPMLVAAGGISAATDLVAGEKERQTLEPLLSTKSSRLSVLMGKYAAVTVFSIAAMISSMIGYILAFVLNSNSLFFMGGEGGIMLPPGATAIALGTVLLLGLMFAGIELTISTFSRSYKEAQTYLGYVSLAIMLPAFGTMMMQAGDVTAVHMLIPVMNASASLKMVLGGIIDFKLLGLGLVASLGWSAIAIALTVRMFERESVLFRS